MDSFNYWQKRAETYGNLDDVKSKRTAYKIVGLIKDLSLNRFSSILDVGCAEGTITKVIRENFRHSNVLGIDLSEKMIERARHNSLHGLNFYCCDFFNFFSERKFDLILFSLVLHHLLFGDDKKAVHKAFNLVSSSGKIIVAEAVAPREEVFDYYKEIFKIKESRNCYLLKDLVSLVRSVGFSSVRAVTFRFDIRLLSWLNDKTLTPEKRELLYSMHTEASSEFKEAYNMQPLGGGDYSLSCKMALIVGKKSPI